MDFDPEVEAAILDRVVTAIPELAGQEVVGRRVGLRPGRPTLRLEALDRYSVPVIACYGHGGAGITLSWGSAEYVTRLVHDSA
jgi:D-amino-acid oxidase